jgi:hypothetical protein
MAKKQQGAKTLVTIITSKGDSLLVEYMLDGVLYRKYVPTHKLEGNFISDEVLEAGIPYGYPWEEMDIKFDMQEFAVQMHNADLWTAADLLKAPKKLTGVLRKLFESQFKEILKEAENENKRR